MNAAPPSMVNAMYRTTPARSPRFDAATASAMVRLDVRRQNVMRLAKAIDGHMGNGVGQLRLAARAYMQEISSDPNVSESETKNSHIPSFLCPTAYGDTPPLHSADVSTLFVIR